ncbi:sensor histidine kinase [Ideonella sp. BN130291]|uniref:sensor histidine kinase n=1 Tax=Ideonella sp. BN130291 TaxID=3112940 RepID=UPI002E272E98|nr:ATP-binding protein [Ideonella sp. BN130291]
MAASITTLRLQAAEACRWFARVHTQDPVRAALNAGLSWVLAALAVLALLLGAVVVAIGRPALTVCVVFAVTPLCGVCWWLNRRGGTAGAWGLVLLMVAASTLGIDPQLYAGAVPTVDVAFMYAIVVAALFVRPGAAALAWLLQLVALAAAASLARLPVHQVLAFLGEAAVELGALGAMAAVGARMFVKALRDAEERTAALAASQARVRQLIDASVVGIVVAEIGGPILNVNDAFLSIIGRTRAEFDAGQVQRRDYLAPHARATSRAAMQQLRETGTATYELDLVRKDGTTVPVLVSASRFAGTDQGVAFVLDMTEARRLEHERQLRAEAEAASQAKTAFLASMSHELRTPLNAVLGFTQILLARGTTTPEQRRLLALVESSGDHLLRLVEELLDLARLDAGRLTLHPAPFELAPWLEVLRATCELRTYERPLHFDLQAAGLPATLVADELRLRQVLLNLLDNAVKFTPAGKVVLHVSAQPAAAAGISRMRFEVEDSGIGIAPHELERIFRAFEQAGNGLQQRQGVGLGLAISRELVRAMGGELRVRSTLGEGSTFWFELDLPEGSPSQPPTSQLV